MSAHSLIRDRFQSTLPHGERRASSDSACSGRYSNFNPRSRTGSDGWNLYVLLAEDISIHAPARGATREEQIILEQIAISIHAPARGATYLCLSAASPARFQSTLPHGERPMTYGHSSVPAQFQSTLPHGERRTAAHWATQPRFDFNPRSRTGSDGRARWRGRAGKDISIHAPARGATTPVLMYCITILISIHAPARGATANLDKFDM